MSNPHWSTTPCEKDERAIDVPDHGCRRYELEYELDHGLVDHRPEHEAWLFKWTLQCLVIDSIEDVQVIRQEDDRSMTFTIRLVTQGETESAFENPEFRSLLARLERWVGEVAIRVDPGAFRSTIPRAGD